VTEFEFVGQADIWYHRWMPQVGVRLAAMDWDGVASNDRIYEVEKEQEKSSRSHSCRT